MTQEEAKEILREVHENSVFSVRTALETFFPEFKHRVITEEELLEDTDGSLRATMNGWI